MKKTIYNKICALLVGSLLTACGSDYLDTLPSDKTSAESIAATVDNLNSALNGIHRAMYSQYSQTSEAGESSMNITRDMMGEDLVNSSTGNGWFISDARWISHRNENAKLPYYVFYYYYKLILNANLILQNIDKATGEDETLRRGVKGEALCFRAFAHHELVQLFGKRYVPGADNTQPGVPYRTVPLIEPIARSSVEEVYAHINRDLDEALPLLEGYTTDNINHFTLKVAYGLKARVALVQGRWADAARYAALSIERAKADGQALQQGEELLSGFSSGGDNKEWMWASLMKDDQTIYFYSFFSFMSWNFNSTNVRTDPKCINDRLYARLSPTDIRARWWDPTGTLPGPTGSFNRVKYQNRKFAVKGSTSVGDVVYMRLAEMYLIRAEALACNGQDGEAAQVLKEYMLTRDPEFSITRTGEALTEEIMTHRRVELWGEGFRFTDLKRLDLPLDREGTNHILSVSRIMQVPAGDKRWQFLIPRREMETNPEMTQNEL